MRDPSLAINSFNDREEDLLGKKTMADMDNRDPNQLRVTYYDPACEDHNKIERIIPVSVSVIKTVILCITTIITGTLILFFIYWFPKLKFIFRYSVVPIESAQKVAIYGTDGELYFVDLEKPTLPDLEKKQSFLYTKYSVNIPRGAAFVIFFTFKLFKYVFDPMEINFVSLKAQLDTSNEEIITECAQGLTDEEHEHQQIIFGECDLDIHVKSFFRLLVEEFTDPFYLFQVFSVILWYTNEYEYYASIIVFTTLVSLFVGTYETRKNLKDIQMMSRYSCQVNILRKDPETNQPVFKAKSSKDLVPGDIFELQEEGLAMPCDCLLIQGTVIINEAMLTGESTPIIKSQIPKIKDHFDYDADKKYFLFAGTKIIQKRSRDKKKLLGLVTEIGFSTIKGNLIRSILYPKKMDEKFQKDSYKYIAFMSVLCIVGFAISIPFLLRTQDWSDIIKKSLDLVTTAVPPSLPACLGIGISYSINRLKKQHITCIARDRVNPAGKINILCFDKTGTLTEGKLVLSDIDVLDDHFTQDEIVKIAASLESQSSHPIAQAIVNYADYEELEFYETSDFKNIPGKGISGTIKGNKYYAANESLIEESEFNVSREEINRYSADGKTVVCIGNEEHVIGIIAVSDKLRDNAAEVIRDLKESGVQTIMLTGDNKIAARNVADKIGIDYVYSNLLPEDKLNILDTIRNKFGDVAMVGDGINDAPALARSNIGIAMGAAGSDVAIETADIALMQDDISKLPYLFKLSHKTMGIITQNITVAIAVKLICVVLAILGIITLMMSVGFGDLGLTLLVILNSFRIGMVKDPLF